jgi:nitrous oxide reductase accessory protein NosL
MIRRLLFTGITLALIMMSLTLALAEDIRCTECGMTVMMDSKFTSKITLGETVHYFCDIGDLFTYLNKNKMPEAGAEVKDFTTGDWIEARKAFYVNSSKKFKTPMGWGIAAFKDKEEAAKAGNIMDFEGTANALK